MVPAHEHNQITGGLLKENRELRVLLATHYSGGDLYTDDGELQDVVLLCFVGCGRCFVANCKHVLVLVNKQNKS